MAPVVETRIGDVHPHQFGDQALELVDHLERALTDLGLIGGVSRGELRPADDRVHGRRDVVVVGPATGEADLPARPMVAGGQLLQLGPDLRFGASGGDGQRVLQAQMFRDPGEQLFEPLHTNGMEHRALFFGGGRRIVHGQCPPPSPMIFS
jgi:hypothetical protein